MKKGFTLIELLAVILILGIIALIAIPTVNNIINESKKGSFKTSVQNLVRAIEQNCDMERLKGSSITSTYILSESEITPKINIKGSLPTSGTITVDEECNINLNTVKKENLVAIKASFEDDIIINDIKSDAISYIKSKAGAALIDDPAESEKRLIFRGDNNIHNYIYLKENGVNIVYRIVSIESDGTIKVIRDEKLSTDMSWDTRTSSTEGHRLNSNNTYCIYAGEYKGCNAWTSVKGTYANQYITGTVTQNASLNDYLNTTFYETIDKKIKDIIITHLYDIGTISWNQSLLQLYNQTKINTWQGKVGLITSYDWFNASSDIQCNPASNGYYDDNITNTLDTHANNYPCSDENYLYKNFWWWTLSSLTSNRTDIFGVNSKGYADNSNSYSNWGVRPTLYLTSNIKLSGDGTSGSPFVIK